MNRIESKRREINRPIKSIQRRRAETAGEHVTLARMPTSARARTPIPTPTARLKTHRSASLRAFGALFVAFAGRSATGTASSSSRANSIVARAMSADREYAGTAVERTTNGRARAASLSESDLSKDWESEVRPTLLWAAGLLDLRDVAPGKGNTGHCFNDFNHVDATTMSMDDADNENEGRVAGMHRTNALGEGIRAASDPTLGPGGSWCTCILGSNLEPPRDVAHVQFRSKIAWKLVWVPGAARDYSRFVLVDDAGEELATGVPRGNVPSLRERETNYRTVAGGRYAKAADARG